MIEFENKILYSERLTYRLLADGDKDALGKLLSDETVTRPAGFLPAKNDEGFDWFYSELTRYNTGIAVLKSDELIGYFHVNPYRVGGKFAGMTCVSVGFVIGKDYQHCGYGTEMLSRMTEYLSGIFDACFADCFTDNETSRRTIEKCGYKYAEDYTMMFDALGEEKTCHSYYYTNKNK